MNLKGEDFMSKCPFWSTGKEKIECYESCPMNTFFAIEDNCPFKEYLSNSKIAFKDIEDYDYSLDDEMKIDFISEMTK